jgi:hypothetical protein
MKHLLTIMLLAITLATIGNAQDVITTTAPATSSKVLTEIIASSSTKVIKGAPFSAEGVSESVQVLPDGNKITRSSTTKMYRDSEGRFRREGTGNSGNGFAYASGGFMTAYGFQDTISIYDPVDSIRYSLNPSSKSARRSNSQKILTEGSVVVTSQQMSDATKARIESDKSSVQKAYALGDAKANVVVMGDIVSYHNAGKTESLGTKTIEGIQTEGKRTVTTIAAGAVGNEKPIEIVYERWYSKELDLTVYSRQYDPRFGEQTYRLININRSEPDRSLFTVPSDYKIVTEAPFKFYTTKPE